MLGSTASVCRRYGDNDAFPQKENNQFFTLNNMLYIMFCKIPRLAVGNGKLGQSEPLSELHIVILVKRISSVQHDSFTSLKFITTL